MSAKIVKISNPLVEGDGFGGILSGESVRVGAKGLVGEVLSVSGGSATIQVYEDVRNLRHNEKISLTGELLTVELGPGLLENIYDGLQRPLTKMQELSDSKSDKQSDIFAIDRTRKWEFTPTVSEGDEVEYGSILGTVLESGGVLHRIMVPRDVSGAVESVESGEFTVEEAICKIKTSDGEVKSINMIQKWPIRMPRPIGKKILPSTPLYTGQRVFDTMLPLAKGGTAAAVGASGSGKSMAMRQLAKWSEADVVVYVGCGVRGSEIADIIGEFDELIDRRTEKSLLSRTVIIANTSDMPIAARETAIFSGITIAEYYRDMGLDVLFIADSLTRWAEAMRLASEKMNYTPGEGGFPAHLSSQIVRLYERAGFIECLGGDGRRATLTLVGVTSPQEKHRSDPVSYAALRIAKVLWDFDSEMANMRHFPAINQIDSYSLYLEQLKPWYDKVFGADFLINSGMALQILQKDADLQKSAKNFGKDSLSGLDQLILHTAKIIREDFMQQNAFENVDSFSSYEKQATMLSLILYYYELCKDALVKRIADVRPLLEIPACEMLGRAKMVRPEEYDEKYSQIGKEIERQIVQETQRQIDAASKGGVGEND
jgi:V/A-type H+-transporting ATPase subunit A